MGKYERFFIKYLPLKEYEAGATVFVSREKDDWSNQRFPVRATIVSSDEFTVTVKPHYTDIEVGLPKKYCRKQYLCSMNFTIGERIYDCSNDTYFLNTDGIPVSNDDAHVTFINVIGEVSPEAIWIREFMDFKEEDFKRDVLIKNTFDNDYRHVYPKSHEKITLGQCDKLVLEYPIKFKCGNCETFH